MNEEMKEKMRETLYSRYGLHLKDSDLKQILSLETDTHVIRVIKKGEPPLLSDHTLKWKHNSGDYHITDLKIGAEAQRSSDIEFYGGKR